MTTSNGQWDISIGGQFLGTATKVDIPIFGQSVGLDGSAWITTSGSTNITLGDTNMKTLYEIFVIDDEGEILQGPDYVVAADIESAKFKADVYGTLTDVYLEPSDVTIICNNKGTVKVEPKIKAMTAGVSNTCSCK